LDGLFSVSDILIVLSLVPFGFLIYTLVNLDKLGISPSPPRVIVEFSIFLILLLLCIYFKMQWDLLLL
jgi:hypothetical protein